MADHLGLTPGAFADTYCKSYRAGGFLLLRQKPGTQDCVFLEDSLCVLHDLRPTQCRTYPWWPGLLDPDAWAEERDAVCEGMDHSDAGATDAAAAMGDLHEAHRYFIQRDRARDAAHEARRKGRGGAGVP